MGLLKLAIDRQGKVLAGVNGSVVNLPPLFQSNTPTLQITIVDPTGLIGAAAYSVVDLNGSGLRVSIGQTPTGASGGPAPLALQDTFTWNAAGKYFQADLALSVPAIDTYIGTDASKIAFFEVNLTTSGNRETILQTQFDLRAVVDELTTTVPSPTDQYLTKAECLALFAKLLGGLGQTQIFRSPGGIYGREIGVSDDGTGIDNIITL